MPSIRKEMANNAVEKINYSNWLNKLAEENKINFSQVMQEALKEQLGINNISKLP